MWKTSFCHVSKHGFLRSKEKVNLNKLPTTECLGIDVPWEYFKETIIGDRCCITIFGKDVFLNVGRCYGLRLDGRCYDNVANGIPIVLYNVLHELCYLWVADGTASVADVRPPCDKYVGR